MEFIWHKIMNYLRESLYLTYLKTFTTITEKNRQQLDVLTRELVQYIKDGDTAVQIVPIVKRIS